MKQVFTFAIGLLTMGQIASAQAPTTVAAPISGNDAAQQILASRFMLETSGGEETANVLKSANIPELSNCIAMQGMKDTTNCALVIDNKVLNILLDGKTVVASEIVRGAQN